MNFKKVLRWLKSNSIFRVDRLALNKLNYIEANSDVAKVYVSGCLTAEQHFRLHGFDEVREGKRLLALGLPYYNEEAYLLVNDDVASAVSKGDFESGYLHYLRSGALEMLAGKRPLSGKFKQLDQSQLLTKIKPFFDYVHYQNTNQELISFSNDELWKHFVKCGYVQVLNGKKELYQGSGLFDEIDYVESFCDVLLALKKGDIQSPIEHFLMFGAKELKDGNRFYASRTKNSYLYITPELTADINQTLTGFNYQPVISIVMPVYNVESKWLLLAYKSLAEQWYKNWELCICDDASTNKETLGTLSQLAKQDCRIKIVYSTNNENISLASNKALSLAHGEFVALMDHDDELTIDALYEVVKALQNKTIDFVYSDEDKIELSGRYVEPHFKPNFAPDMFLAHNYLSHLGVIRKDLINQVGGWRAGYEGAQDYDLYLRVLEKTTQIYHIDKVLYHWRKIPGSTANEFSEKSYAQDAGANALTDAMNRRNIKAQVINGRTAGTYRVNYEISDNPLVSIIIPFRDQPQLLTQCLDSILTFTSYQNIEIICIDNQSKDLRIAGLKNKYSALDSRIKFFYFDEHFNYSKINNIAVSDYTHGDYLLFMNNDIELFETGTIESLLEHAQRTSVGAVGAQLIYPNETIQHAGLVITPNTGHAVINVHKNYPKDDFGYFSRLQSICNYSAVTAALLMVSRANFEQVKGFEEQKLAIAYNDVDLCLKLIQEGRLNIYTPFVRAYHHESASRGYDINIDKINNQRQELHQLKKLHPNLFTAFSDKVDSYYNINFSPYVDNFQVALNCTADYKRTIIKPFSPQVVFQECFQEILSREVCIFAHYDSESIIKPSVIFYLQKLAKDFDIIFVSTAEHMTGDELLKISPYICHGIVKTNSGYDFGSWATGIQFLGDKLKDLDLLLLANDSVLGPLSDLSIVVNKMQTSKSNVFAISDSFEINYHLQSYFILYDQKAINSDVFFNFWLDFSVVEDKSLLILKNEIGFSQQLIESGLKLGALVPASEISFLNNCHAHWKRSILQYHSPFIKIELIRDNPLKIDISTLEQTVKDNFDYPIAYLKEHFVDTL
jgi:glycosyltransferase involved in cell wall biosynthesis